MSSHGHQAIIPPRENLAAWMARLYSHRLTTTTGGNLSLMDDDGVMYITPSGGDKAVIDPKNIAYRYPNTEIFEGPLPPSMEWPLHTKVYEVRDRKECRAVLHAHSLNLVSFSLHKEDETLQNKVQYPSILFSYDSSDPDKGVPDTRCLIGAWSACGRVALAPYALPGSEELADGVAAAFRAGANCVVLQNHGVVTCGKTVQQAFDRFVTIEHLAQSIIHATVLGTPKPLPSRILAAGRIIPQQLLPGFPRIAAANPDSFPFELPSSLPRCECSKGCSCCQDGRTITGREKALRYELCQYIKRAYDQNIISSSSGSFSVRVTKNGSHHDTTGETGGTKTAFHNTASVPKCPKEVAMLVSPTEVDRKALMSMDLCFISNAHKCCHQQSCDEFTRSGASSAITNCTRPMTDGHRLWHNPMHTRGEESIYDSNKKRRIEGGNYTNSCNSQLCYHPIHSSGSLFETSPSRASILHATIYEDHPDVNCIMAVQPHHATSFCITGSKFDASLMPESHIVLRNVKHLPIDALENGGKGVSDALDPKNGCHTVLISGFGLLTVGSDLLKTFVQIEVCDEICGVILTAKRRGSLRAMTQEEIHEIDEAFTLRR